MKNYNLFFISLVTHADFQNNINNKYMVNSTHW